MHNTIKFAPGPDADHVWVYRVCDPRGFSYGGRYQWPTEAGATVEFDDWRDDDECGGGGHGWLLGMGDANEAGVRSELLARGLWYLLRVRRDEIRILSASGKVKFRRCHIERIDRDRSRVIPHGWHGMPLPKVTVADDGIPLMDGHRVSWGWAWVHAPNEVRSTLNRFRTNWTREPFVGQTVGEYYEGTGETAPLLARLWHGPYDWGDLDFPLNPAQCHDMIKPARVFIRWQTSDELGWGWHAICRGEVRHLNDWSDVSPPHRWWRNGAYRHLRSDEWYELLPNGELAEGAFTTEQAVELSRVPTC